MAAAAEILNIQRQIIFDESIAHYEAHAHLPYALSTFNNSDEIRIAVQHQDLCLLPSKSTLHVYGKFTKSDGTAVSATTHMVNMTGCHMFEEIRYERMVLRLIVAKINITLQSIPLSLLLGFAEDYHKIVINARYELILIRSNSDLNAYIVATPAAGAHAEAVKITLQKIEWIVPYVTMADKQKIEALNYITSDPAISISFHAWELYEYPLLPNTSKHIWAVKTSTQLEKPRFVILGFQTARKNDATKNASGFDHCNIRDIKLFLNSQSYPYRNLNLNIANNQYALLYDMYINFQISCYNKEPEPLLTKKKFLEQAPLYVIDCSKQNESIKSGPVDIRLEFESANQFPAQTSAYCLIIRDRIVEYNPMSSIVQKLI
ncbi:uncharacterized protein LOC130670489 [Microplitis mediator]|uniref:uncharacterized protein LOC130670489 n=1 Tax=Microplitis mediator TaxID=375433 RepID=UPI0025540E45|nr:uncharacterized protein LOC130670489 [Microplitis mediator]